MKYVSIPVEVEAIVFNMTSMFDGTVKAFIDCGVENLRMQLKGNSINLVIEIDGKSYLVLEGDYLIKDSYGNLSVMKPAQFKKSYVPKEEE